MSSTRPGKGRLVPVHEAARRKGVSPKKIKQWAKNGELPGAVRKGKQWFIPEAALDGSGTSSAKKKQRPPQATPPQRWYSSMRRRISVSSTISRIVASVTILGTLVGLFARWPACVTNVRQAAVEWHLVQEFAPANEGELLVVVARFKASAGTPDNEPHQEIAQALRLAGQRQSIHNRLRVEVSSKDVPIDAVGAARELGRRYGASLVIWGANTGVRVTVNTFDLLSDRPEPTTITTTDNVIVDNPSGYKRYVTDKLPARLTSLALSAIAALRFSEGAYSDAITLGKEALEAFPKDEPKPRFFTHPLVAALTARGRDFYANDDSQRALEDFDAALGFTEWDWQEAVANAYHNRGLAKAKLELFDGALEDLDRSIALEPKAGGPHLSRAWLHEKRERLELAERDYDAAIELRPDWPIARLLRGFFLTGRGQLAKALNDCEWVLQREPANGQAHQCRGNVLAASGDKDGALAEWQRAQAACGEFCDLIERGSELVRKRDLLGALVAYDRAIALKPSNYLGYLSRGIALHHLGRYAEARIAYIRAVELQPDVVSSQQGLGGALYELRRYNEAIASFSNALQLEPANSCTLNSRALAYEALGDAVRAKADRAAAEQLPQSGC